MDLPAAAPRRNSPSGTAVSEDTAVPEGLFRGFDDTIPPPAEDTVPGN